MGLGSHWLTKRAPAFTLNRAPSGPRPILMRLFEPRDPARVINDYLRGHFGFETSRVQSDSHEGHNEARTQRIS